ncbi:hypothetical protein [Longimicrobium sp.]|uniref:hypothetical protein n=1 Tax=Longimicrobium sp. TaxID=2029185 RepID=UPI002C64E91C|nr:hypothetical protein [Longimicrobium sp.]HSU18026.1 hypothetical protein [Longimicrobium sp.]
MLLAACTDRLLPTAAAPALPAGTVGQVTCSVNVPAQTMSCTSVKPAGPRGDRIIGKQDVYVKLSSSGTTWDAGTEILSSNVVVQNLADRPMGTPDGFTVSGVKVFFQTGPTVTSGTGSVTVANPDGTDGTFLASNQTYFSYGEILSPYQLSRAKTWQFNVPSTVVSFEFTVYVSTPLPNENDPLVDKVWTGAVDSVWSTPGNWQDGVVPDSSSVVAIPPDSLLASHTQPVLAADADVGYLRVGAASSLGLKGFTLRARANVDAVGTISGGTVWMSGTGALLRGNVDALQVSGSTQLQGTVKATGAVSVTGSLSVKDQVMSIQLP